MRAALTKLLNTITKKTKIYYLKDKFKFILIILLFIFVFLDLYINNNIFVNKYLSKRYYYFNFNIYFNNFLYWFFIFFKCLKSHLFYDTLNDFLFLHFNSFKNLLSLDYFLLKSNKLVFNFSDKKPIEFYIKLIKELEIKLSSIKYTNYDYYQNRTRFWRINIINGNTPVFFYFGLLFFFSNLISILLLSYLGFYGVFFINLLTILFFWLSTILYFNLFFYDNISYKIILFKWFLINSNDVINFEFLIDPISYSFMFLTLTIAVFVYMYAFSYFRYEPNVERLIILINFFVISMICLVISGNLFVLFLGWELIGLTSFFLINFWSTRMSTLKSAFKAFTFNKISDVSLLLSIIIIYYTLNNSNINIINNQISNYNNFYLIFLNLKIPVIELISFFLILCSFIKSAQFGFHLWLPDSMEAPVPASALIHSATLVSAGIFLLLRFSNLFEYSYYCYFIVPIIGSFTAFFGGVSSLYQSDVKKILAYSTISHCGFLMVCISTYITEYTILYLYIHGFFKAAVFLCVGNIIRFSKNYQDFRRMGGFWKYIPFECFSSFVCLINLSGLPFSIGFYIKHLLLIGLYFNNFVLYFIFTNVFCAALTGLFYSYRLFYYVFFDFKKGKKNIYFNNSKINLNSKLFYSNSSFSTNKIIFMFMFTSCIISLYLFEIFLNKNSLGDGLYIYSLNQIQFYNFLKPSLNFINNTFYFNILILIFINIILFFSWRKVFNNNYLFNLFFFFVNFFIFFYFFLQII